MAHRNVHVFKPQQNITVYNKRTAPPPSVQQTKGDDSIFLPFIAAGVLGLALGIGGNLLKKTPVEITPEKPVEQPKPQEREKIEVEPLKKESPLPINTMTEIELRKRDEYKVIEEPYENETYKIEKYDTWYLIAGAKYNIPEGVSLQEVHTALQWANFDGTKEEFDIARKTTGILFYPGDIINLPKTLDVNGTEVSLFEDHENREINRKEYQFTLSEYRTAKVRQVGSNFYVVVNGQLDSKLGPFPSEQAAHAKILELNNIPIPEAE